MKKIASTVAALALVAGLSTFALAAAPAPVLAMAPAPAGPS